MSPRGRYAASTEVSVERSRMEIERLLGRYGATAFAYMASSSSAIVAFELQGRQFKIGVPLPDRDDAEFTRHSRGRRTPEAVLRLWEQACRQRWRALLLLLKANLEAVTLGLLTLDEALLPFVMLPNGETVGEWMMPQVVLAYEQKQMPGELRLALPRGGDDGI